MVDERGEEGRSDGKCTYPRLLVHFLHLRVISKLQRGRNGRTMRENLEKDTAKGKGNGNAVAR
jgi:hypothetical protein